MTVSRLIFMTMPDAATLAALQKACDGTGLMAKLGADAFPPDNWHQSLSDRFADTPENLEMLRDAGGRLRAAPFVMTLSRLTSDVGLSGIYWTLRPAEVPKGFKVLLAAMQTALLDLHQPASRHTAHLTLSYHAAAKIPRTPIAPVDWRVSDFALVRGGGKPYRYEVIRRWPLTGRADREPAQAKLF